MIEVMTIDNQLIKFGPKYYDGYGMLRPRSENIFSDLCVDVRKYNNYEHFTKFIHAMYPNAKKILDVGCGKGESSILLDKLGYQVTAIDPKSYNKLQQYNIKFICDYFNLNTDISEFDLVVGLHCCTAIEIIMRNCIKNDKEFVVTLCELNQGIENKNIRTRKEYVDYLKSLNQNLKMTVLPIYDLDSTAHEGETIYYKKFK